MGGFIEDFLDVLSHVNVIDHGIAFVEDEELKFFKLEFSSFTYKVSKSARSSNNDLRLGGFEGVNVDVNWIATSEEAFDLQVLHELAQSHKLIFCLLG